MCLKSLFKKHTKSFDHASATVYSATTEGLAGAATLTEGLVSGQLNIKHVAGLSTTYHGQDDELLL